ncbi:MAG TPA: Cysteine--tRNA ligase [Hyphomicrobiaceae bacterium MAG_BT-2024]
MAEQKIMLYNSLTRIKDQFVPIDQQNVRMYVCGPTVYDLAHIGNARPVVVFDVLYRVLRHIFGIRSVTYVRNITDVDDKINQRALEDYPNVPLNEAINLITTKTEAQFHQDISALEVLDPTFEPRATGHIPEMRDFINNLISRGNAYVAEDHVLFDVSSMSDYGSLSYRTLNDMEAGVRIEVAPYKKKPMDFVLWKPSKKDEPSWVSPGNIKAKGRPGWHIECSAMSERYLGKVFDIHGGGIDLIFPHHENEIAQSRCAHGTELMAQVWMHNGFLKVEGEKMSKSLGNVIAIRDLLETKKFGNRIWSGPAIRIAMLTTHYRQPINWTVAALIEAEKTYTRWVNIHTTHNIDAAPHLTDTILSHLCNDLNTPGAIAELHSLANSAEKGSKTAAEELSVNARFLGISFEDHHKVQSDLPISASRIDQLIAARSAARQEKNWADADRIRNELNGMGIRLMDRKHPETGKIITTWQIK